jgi:S1-C subfamily serine protease
MIRTAGVRGFVLMALVTGLTTAAAAQDTIAPDVLQRLKQSTAFIKVTLASLDWSGSGFVVHTEDDAVYLVTNAHVISRPDWTQTIPFPFGFRGRGMFELQRLQRETLGLDPEVTAVFHSGTPLEEAAVATVVARDAKRDLAVLRVAKLKSQPPVVAIDPQFHPVETTPVFTFGFPFGEALSSSKGHPAITVSRGTISSLRLDDDGLERAVQIDGALNPGNSGGPVVDAQGRLVGVAVATIKGAGIGFAVPPVLLQPLLNGGVADVRLIPKSGAEKPTFDIELTLFDPYQAVDKVTLHCLPKGLPDSDTPPGQPLSDSQAIELTRSERTAKGVWQLREPGPVPSVVTLQPAMTDRQGKTTYLAVIEHKFPTSVPVPMIPRVGLSRRPEGSAPVPAPLPNGRKVLRGAPQTFGDLTLSGGIVVLGPQSSIVGLGLSEPAPGQPAATYFAIYRLPPGDIRRTNAVTSIKRLGNEARVSYGAFLDDQELTIEHAVTPAGRELEQERLTFQRQVFNPADGRVFLIDLRVEPPRVVQKKLPLPAFPMSESLDDGTLLEWSDQAVDELRKADNDVAAFVKE